MKEINKKTINLIVLVLITVIIILGIAISYILNNRSWKQDGNLIYKGNKKYEIGDYYDYDETADGRLNVTDVDWKVLGIDEDGHLLIVSASSVEDLTLGSEQSIENAKNDYLNGKTKMDEIAEKYGQVGAVYSRSITNEDILKVINKESTQKDVENTFYWSTEENPVSDLGEIKLTYKNSTFYYFDENNNLIESKKEENQTEPIKIGTFKSNLVIYENGSLDEYEVIAHVNEKSKEFKMLFLENNNEKALYWTTNNYTDVATGYVVYGYNAVKYDSINYNNILYSSGNTRQSTCGIRVVVGIK